MCADKYNVIYRREEIWTSKTYWTERGQGRRANIVTALARRGLANRISGEALLLVRGGAKRGHSPNSGLMVGQRRRRWPTIEPELPPLSEAGERRRGSSSGLWYLSTITHHYFNELVVRADLQSARRLIFKAAPQTQGIVLSRKSPASMCREDERRDRLPPPETNSMADLDTHLHLDPTL